MKNINNNYLSLAGKNFPILEFSLVCSIFMIPVVVELLFLNSDFYLRWNDNDIGWFGLGLSWLGGSPRTGFHHPSPFFNILSGLFASFITLDGTHKALIYFLKATLAFQFLAAVLIAAYSAWLIRKLQLPVQKTVAAIVLVALMPTSIIYAAHFGNYFLIVMLSLPIGLLTYGWLTRRYEFLVPLCFLFGFLASNFYPFAVLAIIFLIAIVIFGLLETRQFPSFQRGLEGVKRNKGLSLLIGLTVAAPAAPLLAIVLFIEPPTSLLVRIFVAGILLIMIFLAPIIIQAIDGVISQSVKNFQKAILTLLLGWWVGALLLAPAYLTTFFELLAIAEEFDPVTSTDASTYFFNTPWLWLVGLSLTAVVLALIELLKSKNGRRNSRIMVLIFFIGISVPVILVLGSPYLPQGNEGPGMGVRVMIPVIVPTIVSLCYILEHFGGFGRWAISSLVILISLLGFVDITSKSKTILDNNRKVASQIDGAIEAFWKEVPKGQVICARDETVSKYCATAFAYNRYLTKKSRKRMSTRSLYDGRVIWLSARESRVPLENYLEDPSKPFLVVGERSRVDQLNNPSLKNSADVITTDRFVVLRTD